MAQNTGRATGTRETVGEVLMSVIKGEKSLQDIMAPPSVAWNAFKEYVMNIDWAAEWIWLTPLVTMELLLLILVIVTRRNITIQSIVFFSVSLLLAFVGPINTFLMKHWTNFATQPLFDQTGSFIALVLVVPLFIVLVICIINFYVEIFHLLAARQKAIAKNKKNDNKKDENDDNKQDDSKPETKKTQ